MFTLNSRQTAFFAENGWVEGIAREGRKLENGQREITLRHLTLLVPVKDVQAHLRLKVAKSMQAKAQGSQTWRQVGPTTFFHNYGRCNAFADNAKRLGVVTA